MNAYLKWPQFTLLVLLAMCLSCGGSSSPSVNESIDSTEIYSGGETTVFDISEDAFSFPASNLSADQKTIFEVGNSFFNQNWVTAPSSTTGRDGLGPTFNAASCSSCHLRDGRGSPPQSVDEEFVGLLIRLSTPGEDEKGAPLSEPNYGGQFNHKSIDSVESEGKVSVSYEEITGSFSDGETYTLRKPTYTFSELSFGDFSSDILFSPRIAPIMVGMGLLEAIPEETLLELSDESDADGDGVSGRPNYVWNYELDEKQIGRFGLKSNQPTIFQQVSGAFLGDIGITSSLFSSENCPDIQVACLSSISGGTEEEPEISDEILEMVVFYSRTLGVPARRNADDPIVLKGKKIFSEAGCAKCHTPTFTTGESDIPELSNQTIHPYTDLLLHDMGDDLSDNRPDFLATGNEWRTPPLWGIGLVETVNNHSFFLHDGRARNLTEAILWHGGEGESAKEYFKNLSSEDRTNLITFLESL